MPFLNVTIKAAAKATTQKVVDIIQQARSKGTTLLVFPETFIPRDCFIPGYPYFIECYAPLKQVAAIAQYAERSVVIQGEEAIEILAIRTACRDAGVAISLGISEGVAGEYTLFNSQLNVDTNGEILGVHRKLQPTYVERAVWAQGSGATLETYKFGDGYNMGGLCCWENCMQLASHALVEQDEHIHAAAWPALSTMAGFEATANSQIEALMKSHALMCQTFVICASNYVDEGCLTWMENNLGTQDLVTLGGGWSSIIHPFCEISAGPHEGTTERLVDAEIKLGYLAAVKVLGLRIYKKSLWKDDICRETSKAGLSAELQNDEKERQG
ncbi:carbon-nitrogen hydrolase [Mycena vulgaris]|nr:carbon-nitrogen hydrolase [Mycena vulgaris]